jgi:quercetin dioxygenase-like cupin family protein
MSEPSVTPFGAGEIIGDAPDRRVEILCEHDALHATWTRFGPGREGASPHIHREHTDLFYVLEGELTVRLGAEDRTVAVPAGTLVRVPPLVVHGFRNGGDAELRYVNLHAPGRGFADYMRGLRDRDPVAFDQEDPPADGGRPASEAVIGAEGATAATDGLRVVLLADVEAIGIAETRAEPGAIAKPHVHAGHAESLYVLEGEIALAADGREHRAGAGSWVQVPPGVAHAVTVSGPGPARFLDLHAPSRGFGAFVRALGDGEDEERAAGRAGFDQQPAP